jgi:DNA-binding NtrC family response regulator
MPKFRTLLVSEYAPLIRTVQQAHDSCDHLQLEICGPLGKAATRVDGDDVVLILAHLTAQIGDPEIRWFLREAAANGRATTALVCTDEAAAGRGRALLMEGTTDLVCLPGDTPKIVELMRRIDRESTAPAVVPTRGESPSAPEVEIAIGCPTDLEYIRRVVDQDTTLLLTGETGTGKTALARHIHQSSIRRDRPFMMVDCGALAPSLIESEMFGHVRGSFTGADKDRVGKFASAGGGTLVLDEINSLPLILQSKLLRAVEERVFEPVGSDRPQALRARIIAISNVPLDAEVARERFRADLYYRLNVVGFRLPGLRERSADIVPLVRKFLSEHPVARARGILGIAPDALDALQRYSWPGNIRELRNVVERAAVLSGGRLVTSADLPVAIRSQPTVPAARPVVASAAAIEEAPADTAIVAGPPAGDADEVWRICEALQKHRNNRARAAAELGMSRVSLYKKLHKYGLFDKSVSAASS